MEKGNKKIDVEAKNDEKKDVKKNQSNTKEASKIANEKTKTKKAIKNTTTKAINETNASKNVNSKNKTKESNTKKVRAKNKTEANLETKKSVKKAPNNISKTAKKTTKTEINNNQEVSKITIQTNKKEQTKLTKSANELDEKLVDVSKSEINKKNTKKISKEGFSFKEIFGIVIITALVGFFIGTLVKSNKSDATLSNYEKELLSNYHDILNHYYKDIDARDLVKYATKGMIASLDDPYSVYIDVDAIDDFNIDIYGEYEGIGIEITYNDEYEPIVLTVFPNSPAEKSGVQVGDILVYINDTSVIGKSLDEIKEIISTFGDNEFKMIVQRDSVGHEMILKRDKIVIESVNEKIYEQNNQKIGYLGLNNFAKNSDEQFNEKLKELEKQNIDSLIIDLRYNSGGELETVHNIVSLFIKKGETIYQLKEKDKVTKYYSNNEETRNYNIVVLTNGTSASASELMTGALKEIYGATVIGTKTFGKGTGQQVVTLENGEKYKFTTKEWLTAKGNSINEVGINPTIEVKQSEEYNEEPTEENDAQLQAALEFLGK